MSLERACISNVMIYTDAFPTCPTGTLKAKSGYNPPGNPPGRTGRRGQTGNGQQSGPPTGMTDGSI